MNFVDASAIPPSPRHKLNPRTRVPPVVATLTTHDRLEWTRFKLLFAKDLKWIPFVLEIALGLHLVEHARVTFHLVMQVFYTCAVALLRQRATS